MSEEKNSGWFGRMSNFNKGIILFFAITTTVWGGGKLAVKEVVSTMEEIDAYRAKKDSIRIKEQGLMTTADFKVFVDSFFTEIEVNRITNDSLHMRTFRGHDRITQAIEDARYVDSTLQSRIDALEHRLNDIQGITAATREEQAEQAYTDSLQNELLILKQKQTRINLSRQLEKQHREEMNRIRDLSKDIVIDKGRRKTIRSNPKGAKQGKVTQKTQRN